MNKALCVFYAVCSGLFAGLLLYQILIGHSAGWAALDALSAAFYLWMAAR